MIEKLRQKIASGEAVYGTMLTIFDHPEISRILKNAGFDWFFLDCEHGYPNIDRMYAMFGYAKMTGISALIRIPEINKADVLRVMDMGADGIICPNVETAEEAQELVRLAKYAPLGERGVSLSRPHTGYQKVEALSYMEKSNHDTMIICQMESLKGVGNLDTILSLEGVDGAFIGPNDLTQSMGILNQYDNPQYIETVEHVFKLCRLHGKIAGITNKDLKALLHWKSKGALLLQWGTDVSLLTDKISSGFKEIGL